MVHAVLDRRSRASADAWSPPPSRPPTAASRTDTDTDTDTICRTPVCSASVMTATSWATTSRELLRKNLSSAGSAARKVVGSAKSAITALSPRKRAIRRADAQRNYDKIVRAARAVIGASGPPVPIAVVAR